jgi:hypothetical protein
MKKKIFFIFSLAMLNTEKSHTSSQLDLYGEDVPPPRVCDKIYYTTPAMQGMNKNNLEIQNVSKIIKENIDIRNKENFQFLRIGNLRIILHPEDNNTNLVVDSVWKN